jgi:GGDEF domain-containing protein
MQGIALDCRGVTKQEKWAKILRAELPSKRRCQRLGREEVRPYVKKHFVQAAVEVKIRLRRGLKSSEILRHVDW